MKTEEMLLYARRFRIGGYDVVLDVRERGWFLKSPEGHLWSLKEQKFVATLELTNLPPSLLFPGPSEACDKAHELANALADRVAAAK